MATVRLDRAAIAWVHRDAGHDDPCRSYKVRKNLAGMGKRLGREQAQSKALTAEAMAAIRAKAYTPREKGGVGNRKESEEAALARGTLDVAICSVMRDGLLRRGEAAALCWRDVETDADGTFIKVERSKTDQEGETAIQFIGPGAAEDLEKIRPADAQGDDLVFALGERSISRRIRAAAIHAGLGGRVLRTQPEDRYGAGPGPERGAAYGADDIWPVEDSTDASSLRPTAGSSPRGGRPVLPGEEVAAIDSPLAYLQTTIPGKLLVSKGGDRDATATEARRDGAVVLGCPGPDGRGHAAPAG